MATPSESAISSSILWSKDTALRVAPAVWEATEKWLLRCLPHEGVGLWSGVVDTAHATHWTPLQNVAKEPAVRYAVDPQEWLQALLDAERQGLVPLAIVHSHPAAEAVPSVYDRAHWHYPDLWCVIVSFDGEKREDTVWNAYKST